MLSTIGSLRATSRAQSTFAASCANGMYASTLAILGSGPSGGSAFISPDLGAAATVVKSGYSVSMTGTTATGTACNGATALASGYHAPNVTKSGYTVSLTGTAVTGGTAACNGATNLASGFHAWADPFNATTGTRSFFINTTGTIWQATSTMSAGGDTAAPSSGTPIQ